MTPKPRIAIIGATGAVGQCLLAILAERAFPLAKLHLLASHRSAGKKCQFAGKSITVQDIADFDFSQADIAFFSAGSEVSAHYAPLAAEQQCLVIDNTSCFRYQDDIPLVVPEVNPQDLAYYDTRYIIANPNCSTIQMLVALQPIYAAVGITRINVCTYQAVSGSGQSAINELTQQSQAMLQNKPVEPKVYSKPIAFNVLPHIDQFMENGYTREEMKMVWETQKMLHDSNITINPTCVRVPVFYGHSEALHIETREKISVPQVQALLREAPGVTLLEDDYPTATTHAAGNDAVYVGRVREDISHPNGINLWVVGDNIRKGAALNAVQIAQLILETAVAFNCRF